MATAAEISLAADVLTTGGLVAMPTETVYGLAANALDPSAVGRIFELKGRPASHPLIIHLPAPLEPSERAWRDLLNGWAVDVPELAVALADEFWPGPLTMILSRSSLVPDEVTGGLDTVGLRVPGHPVAQALLAEFAKRQPQGRAGLAAPSANRFGHISPTTAQHVKGEFGVQLLEAGQLSAGEPLPLHAAGVILDGGATEIGLESTIVDLSQGAMQVLRPGAISHLQLRAAADHLAIAGGTRVSMRSGAQAAVPAPGTLDQHYAPRAELRLIETDELPPLLEQLGGGSSEHAIALVGPTLLAAQQRAFGYLQFQLGTTLEEQAHQLYATLRAADARADVIYAVLPPPTGLGIAIRDRLRRAAGLGGEADIEGA